ncbi:hypothetical protein Tco_0735217 [Tanacetum coccineum]
MYKMMTINPHHISTIIQPSTYQPQKKKKPRKPRRNDTKETQPSGPTPNVAVEDFNEEINRVFDLENTKTAQAQEIDSLKRKRIRGRFMMEEMFDTDVLDDEEVVVEKQVVDKDVSTIEEVNANSITTSEKGIVMKEAHEATTTTIMPSIKSQDKGKGIMVEEPLKIKKKDQISFDEHKARRLQAEIDEEERIVVEKAQQELEANIAVIEQWHDVSS